MKPENWMKWDIASDDDRKTRWYLSKFEDKLSGYGFFVRVVEMLYQETDHWILLDDIFVEGLASCYGWQPQSVRQAVAYLIQANLFISEETPNGLRFSSNRLLAEVEKRRKKRKTNAENGRKGGLKSRGSKRSLSDAQPNGKRNRTVAEQSVSGAQAEEKDLSTNVDRSDLTTISSEGAAGLESPPPSLTGAEKRRLLVEYGIQACRHYVPICRDAVLRNKKPCEDFAAFVGAHIAAERSGGRGFFRSAGKPLPEQPAAETRRGAGRPQPGPWNPAWKVPGFKLESPDVVKREMARFEQKTAHLKSVNGHATPHSTATIAVSDGPPTQEPSKDESASPGPIPAAELSSLEPPTESLRNGAETA